MPSLRHDGWTSGNTRRSVISSCNLTVQNTVQFSSCFSYLIDLSVCQNEAPIQHCCSAPEHAPELPFYVCQNAIFDASVSQCMLRPFLSCAWHQLGLNGCLALALRYCHLVLSKHTQLKGWVTVTLSQPPECMGPGSCLGIPGTGARPEFITNAHVISTTKWNSPVPRNENWQSIKFFLEHKSFLELLRKLTVQSELRSPAFHPLEAQKCGMSAIVPFSLCFPVFMGYIL